MALTRLRPETGITEAIKLLAAAFATAGVEEALSDARLLVLAAVGLDRSDLVRDPDRPVGAALARLLALAERRRRREPVSRILGRKEFWGLDLAVDGEVLDPRPDTETVVEAALELFSSRRGEALRILDLGSGSGALLCALLSEFAAASGLAVDISPGACNLAWRNLERHGFSSRAEVRCGGWESARPARFDLVVSNPPYIRAAEIPALDPEVRLHDPLLALDGGDDGLRAFRAIATILPAALDPAGFAVFEIGSGQAAAASAIFRAAGFEIIAFRLDLSQQERAMVCRSPQPR